MSRKYPTAGETPRDDIVRDAERLARWLDGGGDPMRRSDGDGLMLGHRAAGLGAAASLRILLDHGFVVDAVDRDGLGMAHHAASAGHRDCLAMLLDAGVATDAVDAAGWTIVHHAATADPDCLGLAIRHGCPAAVANRDGHAPLHVAAGAMGRKKAACVAMLVASGAPVDAVAHDGMAPVDIAASCADHAVLLVLLAAGALPTTRMAKPDEATWLAGLPRHPRSDVFAACRLGTPMPALRDDADIAWAQRAVSVHPDAPWALRLLAAMS